MDKSSGFFRIANHGDLGGEGGCALYGSGGAKLVRVSYFFGYYIVNNLLRRLSGGEGFGSNVFGGKIVHDHHLKTLAIAIINGSNPADTGIDLRRGFGQQLVQSICFFFCHNRHNSSLLILISQRAVLFSALHRMKYVCCILIDQIIHYFQQIATCVKASEQELVVVPYDETIKQRAGKSPQDISFLNVMLERRLIVVISSVHSLYCTTQRVDLQGIGSGGFFRVANHSDFGGEGGCDVFDNLFKSLCYFAIVGGFTALSANKRRYAFNNNNAAAHIRCKSGKPFLNCTYAHKTSHGESVA